MTEGCLYISLRRVKKSSAIYSKMVFLHPKTLGNLLEIHYSKIIFRVQKNWIWYNSPIAHIQAYLVMIVCLTCYVIQRHTEKTSQTFPCRHKETSLSIREKTMKTRERHFQLSLWQRPSLISVFTKCSDQGEIGRTN